VILKLPSIFSNKKQSKEDKRTEEMVERSLIYFLIIMGRVKLLSIINTCMNLFYKFLKDGLNHAKKNANAHFIFDPVCMKKIKEKIFSKIVDIKNFFCTKNLLFYKKKI